MKKYLKLIGEKIVKYSIHKEFLHINRKNYSKCSKYVYTLVMNEEMTTFSVLKVTFH